MAPLEDQGELPTGAHRGLDLVGGSASELEDDLPYRVFVDALDDYLASLPPDALEPVDADRVRLAQVFPSLSRRAPEDEAITPQERYRTHRSVGALLAVLATSKPPRSS